MFPWNNNNAAPKSHPRVRFSTRPSAIRRAHGISSSMPLAKRLLPTTRGCFASAKTLVARSGRDLKAEHPQRVVSALRGPSTQPPLMFHLSLGPRIQPVWPNSIPAFRKDTHHHQHLPSRERRAQQTRRESIQHKVSASEHPSRATLFSFFSLPGGFFFFCMPSTTKDRPHTGQTRAIVCGRQVRGSSRAQQTDREAYDKIGSRVARQLRAR